MGKDQYKKKTQSERRRHNPIRVPDAHLGHGVPASIKKGKEEAMLPILKKVRNDLHFIFHALLTLLHISSLIPMRMNELGLVPL
jgi:hypothetical protein